MITNINPNDPSVRAVERKEMPQPICIMRAGKYGVVCADIVSAKDMKGRLKTYITMPHSGCFQMVLAENKSKEADWIVKSHGEYFIEVQGFEVQLATKPNQKGYALNLYRHLKQLEEDVLHQCTKCQIKF